MPVLEPPPDLSSLSEDDLVVLARKIQELLALRGAIGHELHERHGKSWRDIETATGWAHASVRRWAQQYQRPGEDS